MVGAVKNETDSETEAAPPVRAAQYVRMSTEHQEFSTQDQAEAIARHAAHRGYAIVRTYADEGKSGLSVDGRHAFRQLIADIEEGRADFEAVLVYDVSRWGRFQDADEGAVYEYRCRRAGVTVVYCAEPFENDGSISSTIVKTVKRAMAGEYSRELSVKVFSGQCRLIEKGFRQGGSPGFGLRRQLIDEARQIKGELTRGQQKSIQTDRVVLVPGPADETETVVRMYQMFVVEHRTEREIAAILNAEGVLTDLGRPWTRGTVHQVLTAEKYIGNNVFNRMSFKLKKKRVANDPTLWIRADGAFPPVVDRSLFDAAQAIISARSSRLSNEEMLERLASVLNEQGSLSALIIDELDDMPSSSAYRSRFGSLLRAYQMVGFTPDRDYRYLETNRVLRALHAKVVEQAIAGIVEAGGEVRQDPATDLLTINGEFTASLVVARCLMTPAGSLRWKIRIDASLRPDITVALRMDPDNRGVLDCYLLPRIDIATAQLRLAEENGVFLDAYRFESLAALAQLSARTSLRRAS